MLDGNAMQPQNCQVTVSYVASGFGQPCNLALWWVHVTANAPLILLFTMPIIHVVFHGTALTVELIVASCIKQIEIYIFCDANPKNHPYLEDKEHLIQETQPDRRANTLCKKTKSIW
jgi:hypothetical protein